MKHHPELFTAGRRGAWCICSCGWRSERFTTPTGAHLAFGVHRVAAAVTADTRGGER